ncbi:MAG: DUF1353 domain-containing protein [Actinomycetota bacterium]
MSATSGSANEAEVASEEGIALVPAFDWRGKGAFEITGVTGEQLPLRQINDKEFVLPSDVTIRYGKKTGLEKYVESGRLPDHKHKQVQSITGAEVLPFDLASVPGPMRWFTKAYGVHTPAAIFHDHLIPNARPGEPKPEPIIPEVFADRYFRYQLGAVGVPRLKRYVMWTATALRTRWAAGGRRQLSVALWALLASVGLYAFFASGIDLIWDTGLALPWWSTGAWLTISLVLPIASSALWGRQFGAGLVAAIAALWVLPPALFAGAGWLAYRGLEYLNEFGAGLAGRDP